MTTSNRTRIHDFVVECLQLHNDQKELSDSESLFTSGRLDSLSVTRLVVFLEDNFQVDFGTHAFDVDLLDTIDQIVLFAETYGGKRKAG
jgi:acyl carrier protein